MQAVTLSARRYDVVTIFFHWTTAVLVVVQWLGAQTIDWFSSGPLRVDARSVHIALGATLAAILAARVAWRLTAGRRLPLADRGALNVVAKGTHWALYALLMAMVLAGLLLTWVRGDSLFNLVTIPTYAPGDRALSHQVQDIHGTMRAAAA